ncbi:MAG: hypothetical protein NTV31_06600 [Bacteroidia bacterium]|nr:hypothetical protein [Bacteroidia bacterium]
MKKILRISLYVAGSIITLLILLFVVLIIQSPGKPRPFQNENGKTGQGTIAVIETVNINGLDQRMIIRQHIALPKSTLTACRQL